MIRIVIATFLLLIPFPVTAADGRAAFAALKNCVMQNDAGLCHAILTPSSHDLFDRFRSYSLMPCLPTNFTYRDEAKKDGWTIVRATMPAPDNRVYVLRFAFTGDAQTLRLDVPESLRIGLGARWHEKIQAAERFYLALFGGSGAKPNCEQAGGLIGQ